MAQLIPVGKLRDRPQTGDVVFVHGLDGDARGTWTNQAGGFWPQWLADDHQELAVWSVGYEVAASAWKGTAMPLFDRAHHVLAELQAAGLGQRPICFVAHSMGGLLVKQMLRNADSLAPEFRSFSAATRGVVFLATPHTGSDLASLARYLGLVLRSTIATRELEARASPLLELNTWYRENVRRLRVDTQAYFENQKTRGVFVVDRASADPSLEGVTVIGLDANHSGVCKPASRNDLLYRRSQAFIVNVLGETAQVPAGGQWTASEPRPDRVIAVARESLRPHTLTPVPRLPVLDNAFKKKRQREEASAAGRQVMVIVGEGGMGKSVLLGQLLDAFDAGQEDPARPRGMFSGAAVLVSCAGASLPSSHLDRNDVDRSLGRAVGNVGWASDGLLSALARLKNEHGSVTLLLDTLDLLLSPETLPALADVIAEALDVGEVIVTCRAQEFSSYLDGAHQGAPRLANRLTTVKLRKLAPEEILRWADAYLAAPGRAPGREDATFRSKLEAGLHRRGSVWEVCSVPVRLALTCEVFAEEGDLPEDLTVAALYNAYWDARVARHAGVRSDAKSAAALAAAAKVVTETGRLRPRVPAAELDPQHLPGLQLLASEGVLTELPTGWEVFHQTFAEYAAARWILTFGPESKHVDQLAEQLRAGRTNLWPLAGSLLLQADRYEDYLALARRLPIRGPEGAKVHTVAALRQPNPQALAAVVQEVERQPELWPAVLPELGNAPRAATAAPRIVLQALREDPRHLASPATAALAALLARTGEDAPAILAGTLQTLTDAHADIPDSTLDQHVSKVLRTQLDGSVLPQTLPVLTEFYRRLGALGRQAIVRIHLDVRSRLTEREVVALAQVALAAPCPPLRDQEGVDLLRLFWDCAPIRTERGWRSWREILADDLPPGTWHNAKVKFLGHLADSDTATRTEIVDDLLDGQITDPVSHINTFEYIAARNPDWLARMLLARAAPTDPRVIGAIASVSSALVHGLPQAMSLQLMGWLTPRREVSPRQVWPCQIVLAGQSVPTQRQLFQELVAANEPQPVIDSAIDAWMYRTTPQVVQALTADLRLLLGGNDPDVLQARARLEGRRADADADARAWITAQVLGTPSSRVAGAAVKTTADVLARARRPVDRPLAEWLTSLVATKHTDAARRLLELIYAAEVVDDATFAAIAPRLVPALTDRLDQAVDRLEDAQLIQAILDCLIRADRLRSIEPDVVRRVYDSLVGCLSRAPGKGARFDTTSAVNSIATVCGTLMARCLPSDEVRQRIGSLLTGFDPGAVANKTVRSVASMLVGIQGRDPQALDWMEDIFGRADTALGVQLAIAEAFLVNDHRYPGGRASRLKDRKDCPPEVVTYIINRLHA
jgi:hypothetical protein